MTVYLTNYHRSEFCSGRHFNLPSWSLFLVVIAIGLLRLHNSAHSTARCIIASLHPIKQCAEVLWQSQAHHPTMRHSIEATHHVDGTSQVRGGPTDDRLGACTVDIGNCRTKKPQVCFQLYRYAVRLPQLQCLTDSVL